MSKAKSKTGKLNTLKTAKNRISEVAKQRGLSQLRPDDSILELLGIKIHTWNKWYSKKSDPSFSQTMDIANHLLFCDPGELFPNGENSEEDEIIMRHKLISPR